MFFRTHVVVSVIAVLFLFSAPEPVTARPLYKTVFEDLYRKRLPEKTKVTCSICHPVKSKKKKSKYGKELEKELGEKNVKDRERIREALKNIEDKLPIPRSSVKTTETQKSQRQRGMLNSVLSVPLW